MMFSEVADDLAAAKCTFVGGTEPSQRDRRPDACRPTLRDLVRAAPDVVLRETLADLCIDRMFRTDIFRRGLASLRHLEHRRFVDAVSVVWSGADYEADREVAVTGGSVRLDESFYRPLVERLAQDALTGAEISEVVRGRGLPESEVGGTLALLVASGYALPALPVAGRAVEPAMRMNRALLERARLGNHLGFLVAPTTGTTIPIDLVGMLAAGACWDGVRSRRREPDRDLSASRFAISVSCPSVTGREASTDAFDALRGGVGRPMRGT